MRGREAEREGEPAMEVKVSVAGLFGGEMINGSFAEDLKEGSRIADLLKVMDRRRRLGRKVGKAIRKARRGTVVLLNGNRHGFDDVLKRELRDGDKLSFLLPIAGG